MMPKTAISNRCLWRSPVFLFTAFITMLVVQNLFVANKKHVEPFILFLWRTRILFDSFHCLSVITTKRAESCCANRYYTSHFTNINPTLSTTAADNDGNDDIRCPGLLTKPVESPSDVEDDVALPCVRAGRRTATVD